MYESDIGSDAGHTIYCIALHRRKVRFYTTLVRSHLEFGNCVWSPFRQMDVEEVERVQMRATRMVKQLKTAYMKIHYKFLICLHSNTD